MKHIQLNMIPIVISTVEVYILNVYFFWQIKSFIIIIKVLLRNLKNGAFGKLIFYSYSFIQNGFTAYSYLKLYLFGFYLY